MAASPPQTSFLNFNNLGFRSALTSIQQNPTATQVQILWSTICASFFPSSEGYKIAILSADDGTTRVVQITEVHIYPTAANSPRTAEDLVERSVFFVKCKAGHNNMPGTLAFDDVWEVQSRLGDRGFAAIAAGTKVSFYKFDRRTGGRIVQLEEFHPGTIDVDLEGEGVEQYLVDIKRQAWNWAG